jgi:photosystem II stability/assembly factor-like uncharacterized protein
VTKEGCGRILGLLLLCFAMTTRVATAGVNRWTSNGPGGGLVNGFVIDPVDTATVYAGTASAGVFKSFNGSQSWAATSQGLPTNVQSLAVDPQRPSTVYFSALGDYEHGSRDYKSVDGGRSWTQMTPIVTSGAFGFPTPITALTVDPKWSDTLYAGATVPGYPTHNEIPPVAEIYKSIDGGRSWQRLFSDSGGVGQILVDREDSAIVYAVVFFKVYRSTDAGMTWNVASPSAGISSLAQSTSNPPTLYVGTGGLGMFRSRDRGLTWEPINDGLAGDALAVDSVAVASPSVVYAATYAGVFRSDDGGSNWRLMSPGRRPRITVDPLDPTTLYAIPVLYNTGTFDGVAKSTDSGLTWSFVNEGLNALGISAIAVDPSPATTIYAGAFRRIFKSVDRGNTWEAHELGPEGYFLYVKDLIFDPLDSQTLYAATTDGAYRSSDGGNQWISISGNLSGNDRPATSLAADPRVPGRFFAGGQYGKVFRTDDGGGNWVAIGPSSTDDGNNFDGLLTIDSTEPGVLYFGSNRGLFRSEDSGATWQQTSIVEGVFALKLDPTVPTTVYASSREGLFRSTDAGLTWQPIPSATIQDGRYVTAIAINPTRPSELYIVVSPSGVFRSQDSGATWFPFNNGLTIGPLISGGLGRLEFDPSGTHLFGAGVGVFEYEIRRRETRALPPRPSGRPAAREHVR